MGWRRWSGRCVTCWARRAPSWCPTHTPDNTDPASWRNPPVPPAWWPVIRQQAPGFDPRTTPSRWMGVVAEAVRTWPGAVRSDHPQVSFAALGQRAVEVTAGHRLDDALGEGSPLGAVYRLDGRVLLLGCGYDSNTSLHLAEYRQPSPPRETTGSSVRTSDGAYRWAEWTDIAVDERDFPQLGTDFEATGAVAVGPRGRDRPVDVAASPGGFRHRVAGPAPSLRAASRASPPRIRRA
ncbi:AAC(3) family N-acetyltransferase [Micromonospora sp. CPCC 206060]